MKSLKDFCGLEINKTKMDQIRGGKKIDEVVYSGSGTDGATGQCVDEHVIYYDDDTHRIDYSPC